VFEHLQIYNRRERAAVGFADAVIDVLAPLTRLRARGALANPSRILVLRLERIGDLLMSLDALDQIRLRAPGAHIHLVIGSWNRSLVPLIPSVDSHEILDAPWLARTGSKQTTTSLLRHARTWRGGRFDLAINFEPDIRSNLLLSLSRAPRRVGFRSGGGGGLLTEALEYDSSLHASRNLIRLVQAAIPRTADHAAADHPAPRLTPTARDTEQADRLIGSLDANTALVGIHVSGGRPSKQWPVERFAELATRLARQLPAKLVLTGGIEDRPLVQRARALLPADVVAHDIAGEVDLPAFVAVLQRLRLFVTGDTGPMHLASAAGTPTVAIFGPSDPRRYGPLGDRSQVVTANLWCRPCNRVRRPPERCSHGTPDCLAGISVDAVMDAARELLQRTC
jgi:lipopolysaccharide heptosyltransferase II